DRKERSVVDVFCGQPDVNKPYRLSTPEQPRAVCVKPATYVADDESEKGGCCIGTRDTRATIGGLHNNGVRSTSPDAMLQRIEHPRTPFWPTDKFATVTQPKNGLPKVRVVFASTMIRSGNCYR